MRRALACVTAVLILGCVGAGGCGGSKPTAIPAAAAYASPDALYRAIEAVGSPRVSGLKTADWSRDGVPASAHAQKGNFLAASSHWSLVLPDGTWATMVIVLVFPDAAAKTYGAAFGKHVAKGVSQAIWQLEGPNWMLWTFQQDTVQAIQRAIGGRLSRASPPPTPSAII